MQNDMGGQGIIHGYRPPYQNFMYKSYPIILNMIPELRQAFEDDILSSRLAGQYSAALQEAMVRHLGNLEDALKGQKAAIKNPIIWLREGVRGITSFPASLLGWLGIISESTAYRFQSSISIKVISGLVTIVGLVSAVFTIILGWNQFLSTINAIFS